MRRTTSYRAALISYHEIIKLLNSVLLLAIAMLAAAAVVSVFDVDFPLPMKIIFS